MFLEKIIGTFFFTGFFPFAPATFASAVFCLLYALLPGGEWMAHPLVLLLTLVVSIPVATRLERRYGHDPSCAVIDEVVGLQVILVAARPTAVGVLLVFFLFRLFDIVKPFPARRSQDLPGGFGVVADDVLAGIYTRLALVVISFFYTGGGTFR